MILLKLQEPMEDPAVNHWRRSASVWWGQTEGRCSSQTLTPRQIHRRRLHLFNGFWRNMADSKRSGTCVRLDVRDLFFSLVTVTAQRSERLLTSSPGVHAQMKQCCLWIHESLLLFEALKETTKICVRCFPENIVLQIYKIHLERKE